MAVSISNTNGSGTMYPTCTTDNNVSSGTIGDVGVSISHMPSARAVGGPCNESKKHNNEEKALYHGLKSAYRMSRVTDGEYGVRTRRESDIPWEEAARIAANVALSYLKVSDQPFTREASYEYVAENFVDNGGLLNYIRRKLSTGNEGAERVRSADEAALDAAVERAWSQVDDKQHHYDAARTALAAAEMYLGEEVQS